MVVYALLTGGCGSLSKYRTPERLERGYTIVLPGVEGRSPLNTSIVKGLADGGIDSAIEVYDWTAGSVLLFPITLRSLDRNKSQARKIAMKIIQYQDQYPDRPVYLIGHSGGGGIAVLALEALPPNRQITSAILLGPAISPDYDLRRALKRTRLGIYNYYSHHDVAFLKTGTFIMGTIDGRHALAAGAVGFTQPWGLDAQGRKLYESRLHQQRYTPKMAQSGHTGGHTGWSRRSFVAEWLAPIIHSQSQADTQTHYAADSLAPSK